MNAELPDDARPTEVDGPVTIHVGAEIFTVTVRSRREFEYSWDSGPNADYGFGGSIRTAYGVPRDPAKPRYDATQYPTIADHRKSAANFLSLVDPETGYIE